jgi:hypothetical protein
LENMLDRLISALVALCLAFLVWLYVRGRDQETLDNVPVPVQVTLSSGQAEHYELEMNGPNQIPISFSGPPSRMRELRGVLQRGELHVEETLTVPEDRLDESRYLDTVRIDASDVHPPAGVTALVLEGRNRIPVTLHRIVDRSLPVRFQHAPDEHVGPVVVEPAMVTVRGMQEVLDRIREIPTRRSQPLPAREPAARPETITIDSVPLVDEIEGHRIRVEPACVKAQVTYQPRQKTYELTDVPVQFLCPASFSLRPVFRDERAGKITLRLLGPSGEEVPTVVAYVDLCGRKWDAGLYEEPLKLQLPKDFQLAQSPPRLVAFQLVPPEQATKPGTADGQ